MPPRVNPVILSVLVTVSVLLFALSASAAPEEGVVPGENVAPVGEGTALVPEKNGVPPGDVPEESLESGKNGVPGGISALESGGGPDEGNVSGESTSLDKGAAPEEDAMPRPEAALEDEAQDAPVIVPEETVETFEEMLDEAEAADGEYKNALFEEGRLNNEIAQTRSDLANAEVSLEEAQNDLEEQATQVYKHGQGGFMSVLLEAKDFRKFANLLGFWVQLLKDDQDKVREWRESKDELEQTTEDLEAQLQSWEQTREEATTQKEQAQARMEEAQNFFESLDVEEQEEIEKEQANESALALDHAEKLLLEASQGKPVEEVESSDQNAGSEQALQTEAEGSNDRTAEEEQVRQVEVAQAVAETIREWPTIKEQVKEESGENTRKSGEGAGETPGQNPAAEQLAAAADKRTEAQEEARLAAEQAARERQAMDEAAARANEAEKARLAAEQAPAAEQEKLRAAAEDARLQANFATEQAGEEKQAAEEIAAQAADKLNTADKEFADAQKAAGKATPFALDPLASGLDSTGQPISPSAGSGVLGEAKSWLGVPYDYTHSKGQTRAGVDCSAFTAAVYKKFGITLPDSPAGQMGMGTPVSGPPKAGDLVFWSEDGSGVPTHVGIANGDGTTTHSSSFTGEVSVTPMKYINGYLGARRLI
jgi:cell wall-associated NlpC family hydrolase